MVNNIKKYIINKTMITILLSTILFLFGFLLNVYYPIITIILLLICGILNYYYFYKLDKSLITLPGVFSIIWFFSISLSQLRLNINQIPFISRTWFILWLSYFAFFCGYLFSRQVKRKKDQEKIYIYSNDRFLSLILVLFIIMIICFIVELIISKEVPLFSNNPNSYLTFSVSGIHYFVVSSALIPSAILVYINKAKKINKKEMFILSIMGFISFLIPVLIVSRQLLLLEIILTFISLILLYKKYELKILITSFTIAVLAFMILSLGRNQNTNYLNSVFNVKNNYTSYYYDNTFCLSSTEKEVYNTLYAHFDDFTRINIDRVPMPFYQVYMYISFNFDNFNYLIASADFFSFGLKSFYPVFALTGLRFIFPIIDNLPISNYLTTFNTYPISLFPYLDFREIGVFVYMFIIGLITYFVSNNKSNNPFKYIFFGLTFYALCFSFFTSFFSNTTFCFYFILLLLATIYLKKEQMILFKIIDNLIINKLIKIWRKITHV